MPSDNHTSTSAATLAALKAELAEARAQIAAKGNVPPVLDELIASLEDQLTKTEDKLREARAQIAELQRNHNNNTQEWMDEVQGLKDQIAAKDAELLAQYEKVFELEAQADLAAIDTETFVKLRVEIKELKRQLEACEQELTYAEEEE